MFCFFFFIVNFRIILLFVEINTLIGRPPEPEHLEDEYSMTMFLEHKRIARFCKRTNNCQIFQQCDRPNY